MPSLFTSAYFAPISYYAAMLQADEVVIEKYNHYEKKTYQNRCEIMSANGVIPLSIPIEKGKAAKTKMKEVKIAYHTPWQKDHLRAIMSAYKNSPFCEYYIDELLPLYEKPYQYLFDFNNRAQAIILEHLELDLKPDFTSRYYDGEGVLDLRSSFTPRHKLEFNAKPYIQVFSDKRPFAPDLSILDLLFNLGPDAEGYLLGLDEYTSRVIDLK